MTPESRNENLAAFARGKGLKEDANNENDNPIAQTRRSGGIECPLGTMRLPFIFDFWNVMGQTKMTADICSSREMKIWQPSHVERASRRMPTTKTTI
jgi:hypothetical protein